MEDVDVTCFSAFPFCHPDIARILQGPTTRRKSHNNSHGEEYSTMLLLAEAIQAFGNYDTHGTIAMTGTTVKSSPAEDDLVDLALLCDDAVFSCSYGVMPKQEWDENENENENNQRIYHPSLQMFLISLVKEVMLSEEKKDDDVGSLITVTTLLALNALESIIRQITVMTKRGSPLLKDMLQQLYQMESVPSSLATISSLLLLPHGLNFRNLIWHGFLASVPRPWFSLIVVLALELQGAVLPVVSLLPSNCNDTTTTTTTTTTPLLDLRTYPEFERLLNHDKLLNIEHSHRILEWVQHSTSSSVGHVSLCRWALKWLRKRHPSVPERPATICAVLSIVLEHVLRLEFCRANNRPQDRWARPGAFYVTLDGHGQRHVHDLILHPYVSRTGENEDGGEVVILQSINQLLCRDDSTPTTLDERCDSKIDPSTLALLTDLYCSPFGPNIRSAVAHGLWNDLLVNEWCNRSTTCVAVPPRKKLWDMAIAIYIAMARLSCSSSIDISCDGDRWSVHRPVFTYAQHTRRNIRRAKQGWVRLQDRGETINIGGWKSNSTDLSADRINISLMLARFDTSSLLALLEQRGFQNDPLPTIHDEYELNRQLASQGIRRNLLQDVANAMEAYSQRLSKAINSLNDDDSFSNSSQAMRRKQKKAKQVIQWHDSMVAFYNFSYWVALASLEAAISGDSFHGTEKDSKNFYISTQLVKRTSMVLSTVETFVNSNLQRAVRAILEFCKSKVLQGLLTAQSETTEAR
jgi:hypothetical protein